MKRVVLLGAPGLAALIAAASRLSPAFADLWSRTAIAAYAALASRLTSRLPFPLLELLAIAAAALLAAALLRRRFRALLRLASGLLALLLTGYCALWLPLYYAPGARPYPAAAAADAAAIGRLAGELIEALAAADAALPAPADIPRLAAEALAGAGEAPFTFAVAPPKAARYPEWLRAGRLAGLFSPWTAEALYASERPLAAQTFTACHELMHLYGIADEGQANIAAFRACVRAGGAAERSAYLHALACALPRLRALSPAAWGECVVRIDAQSLQELRAMGGLTGAAPARSRAADILAGWAGIRASLNSYAALVDHLAAKGLSG